VNNGKIHTFMPGGVFCIENWSNDLRSPTTVRPLLDFLESSGTARCIHQRVSTPRELRHYLARFANLESYRVGYLALHGERGRVLVGSHELTLENLVAWATLDQSDIQTDSELDEPEWVVDLTGKVLYLGSCATLHISHKRLAALQEQTGALAVCGYTKYVEWFASGGFDVMLLSALAEATSSPKDQAVSTAFRRLHREAGDLLTTLGFRCEPNWLPTPRSR
jgi:hypothetical protein